MALTGGINLTDARSATTRREFELVGATVAVANADLLLIKADLLNLVDAGCDGVYYREVTQLADAASANANLDAGLTIGVTFVSGAKGTLHVPSPILSKVQADRSIALDDVQLLAYVAHFQALGKATVNGGEVVSTIRYARLDR